MQRPNFHLIVHRHSDRVSRRPDMAQSEVAAFLPDHAISDVFERAN